MLAGRSALGKWDYKDLTVNSWWVMHEGHMIEERGG